MPTDEHDLAYLLAKARNDQTEEDFKGVRKALSEGTDALVKSAFEPPFVAPPLFEWWHRESVHPYGSTEWEDKHVRRAVAYERDITQLFHRHITERRAWGGNVVFEFGGMTGTGKSSCMLGLMERHNGLTRAVDAEGLAGLRRHISIDIQELPQKIEQLKAGEAIAMDEQLHLVGEGAETATKMLSNLEDTLRGTQIDLHFASPGKRDHHAASQGYLEAVSSSPPDARGRKGKLATRFLFHMGLNGTEPIPLGRVELAWCSPKVFEAYSAFKAESLDRTRRAQFTNATANFQDVIKRIFEHDGFQARLRHNLRPTKAELEKYVRYYAGTSLSIGEQKAIASEIEEMLNVLKDDPKDFPKIWGYEPTPAMLKAAGRGNDGNGGIRSM